MNPNVTCLRLFPGITTDTIRAILAPTIRGVVLESFGAGNAPDNRMDVLDLFRDACDRDVVIVNISQCRVGNVSDLYATGKALTKAGVIPGLDMTTECALTKLACLLADETLSPEESRKAMMQCRAGELTKPKVDALTSVIHSDFSGLYTQLIDSLPTVVKHQFEPMLSTQFFHIAASKDEPDALESILRASENFNIDVRDYMENTALLNAVSRGCVKSTKWLLDHGASVHVRNSIGQASLQIAIFMRNSYKKGSHGTKYKQIIRMLLAAGARSDASIDL
jgi:lysophospholipase